MVAHAPPPDDGPGSAPPSPMATDEIGEPASPNGEDQPAAQAAECYRGGLRWSAQAEAWWIRHRPSISTACAAPPRLPDPGLQELLNQFAGATEPGRQTPSGAVPHPIRPAPEEMPTEDGTYSSGASEISFDRVTTEWEGRFDHVVRDASPTAAAVETHDPAPGPDCRICGRHITEYSEPTLQDEEGQPNHEEPVAETEQPDGADPDEMIGESEVAGETRETGGDETVGQEAQSGKRPMSLLPGLDPVTERYRHASEMVDALLAGKEVIVLIGFAFS